VAQTLFIDDIDGSAAEGTVRFGLDGTEYEIDLNAEHAQQLRDALAGYVRVVRRVGGGPRRPAAAGAGDRRARRIPLRCVSGPRRRASRKGRRRVPAELVVKFEAATAN
jgi:hypothetical protein